MKRILFLLILLSFDVYAEVLKTPSYEIEIGSCPEGYVSCDTIPIDVKNLKTGIASSYIGGTLHTLCADGVTPCRFLGYDFTGEIGKFHLYENGFLEVSDESGQAILSEQGHWLD
jgi:hypothetical protein